MLPDDLILCEFDPNTATEDEWAALYAFNDKMRAEMNPEVSPISLDAFKRFMLDRPLELNNHSFVITRQVDSAVVAMLRFSKWVGDTDGQLGDFQLGVLPEYRNRGLGTQLLAQLASMTQQARSKTYGSRTSNHVPAGAAFMRQLGGSEKFVIHTDILDMANVQPDQRQHWREYAKAPLDGYTMGFWEDIIPEESLEEVAGILDWQETTAPSKNSRMFRWTPDRVRQYGENMKNSGTHMLTGYIKDAATNTMIAIILAYWYPNDPNFAEIDISSVKPPHDAYILGRQLKAATLEKLLEAHPQITQVRAGELSVNEPLTRANRDLGFVSQTISTMWEIETEQIQNYLAQQQMAPAKS